MKIIVCLSIILVSLIGCESNKDITNSSNFKIVENKFKFPDINITSFDNKQLAKMNIRQCIFYKMEHNPTTNNYNFIKSLISNYDSLGNKTSVEYFNSINSISMGYNQSKKIVLKDTSYWEGNKHVFKIVTDSTREYYCTKYKVHNNLGYEIYDSSYIIHRNKTKKFNCIKYDYDNNLVIENSNGKIQRRKYTHKNNKIAKIDYLTANLKPLKKEFFTYNKSGKIIEHLTFYNNDNKNKNKEGLLKKLIYGEDGLLTFTEFYTIEKLNINKYIEKKDTSVLKPSFFFNEKYEWIKG